MSEGAPQTPAAEVLLHGQWKEPTAGSRPRVRAPSPAHSVRGRPGLLFSTLSTTEMPLKVHGLCLAR